jgi:hypothetical protein
MCRMDAAEVTVAPFDRIANNETATQRSCLVHMFSSLLSITFTDSTEGNRYVKKRGFSCMLQ